MKKFFEINSFLQFVLLLILLFLSIFIFSELTGFEVSDLVKAEPDPWFVLCIGLFVFAWRIYSDSRKWKFEKSGFCFTSALDAFEEAHHLLSDGNNDRVTWISAARALKRGKNIADGLTEQVHKDVLDVALDRYRIKFGKILGADNPGKDIAFFKGGELPGKVMITAEDFGLPRPLPKDIDSIPPSTLKVIWDFAQFPAEYEDPIPFGDNFSDAEIDRSVNSIIYPGLFEYLKVKREWTKKLRNKKD